MCEHCEAKVVAKDKRYGEISQTVPIYDKYGTCVVLGTTGVLSIISKATKHLVTQIQIEYCPICGRYLSEESKPFEQLKLDI